MYGYGDYDARFDYDPYLDPHSGWFGYPDIDPAWAASHPRPPVVGVDWTSSVRKGVENVPGLGEIVTQLPGWLSQTGQAAVAPLTSASNATAQISSAAAQAKETARRAQEHMTSVSRKVEATSNDVSDAAVTIKWVAIGIGVLGGAWLLASIVRS